MKVLIIITGHKHNEEYKLYGMFLNNCKNILKFDFILHNNCITNNIYKNVEFIKSNKKLIITNKNNGFKLGAIEALCDIIDNHNLLSSEYDYIIHTHPDVFITNESKIIKLLEDELYTDNIFLVTLSLKQINMYAFDFFIFKPNKLNHNIFNYWHNYLNSPEHYLYEKLINIKHKIVDRYDNNYYLPRKIDKLSLLHLHDINSSYFYILSNSLHTDRIDITQFNLLLTNINSNNNININYNNKNCSSKYNSLNVLEDHTNIIKLEFVDGKIINCINNMLINNINQYLFLEKKKVSLIILNNNNYIISLKLLEIIRPYINNYFIIIVNDIYNIVDGDYHALYEFIIKYNIKCNWSYIYENTFISEYNIF